MKRTLTILPLATGLAAGGFASAADLSRPDQKQLEVQQSEQTTSAEQRKVDKSTPRNETECKPDCAHERQEEKHTLRH